MTLTAMKYFPLLLLAALPIGGMLLFGTSILHPIGFSRPSIASESPVPSKAPKGFELASNSAGVQVYRRNNGLQSYVTVLDLSQGAMRSLTGEVGADKQIGHRSLMEYWNIAKQPDKTMRPAKVVINGTFFARYNQPTDLAFGLKRDGEVITYGYGLKEFPGFNKTIAWDFDRVQIQPYTKATFDGPMGNVVGALDVNAGKRKDKYLPRTFIGTKGKQVFIFSSNYARQIDAVRALQEFGAESMAMLDGGGSTGLIVDGQELLQANTKVPHGIAIYSGR
jgi:Phosphodiester glycosidase